MIVAHARMLIEQGRGRTVETWIDTLPAEDADRSGWIAYWRSVARCAYDPVRACDDIERAYDRFVDADDALGALLACAQRILLFSLSRTTNKGADQ